MLRKYEGAGKAIEARSNDGGRTWKVKVFDAGHLAEYGGAALEDVDALADRCGLLLASQIPSPRR